MRSALPTLATWLSRSVMAVAVVALVACAAEAPEEDAESGEVIATLGAEEAMVRWTLVTPEQVEGVVGGEWSFLVRIEPDFAFWFDERRGRSLGLHLAEPPSLTFSGPDGLWYRAGAHPSIEDAASLTAAEFTQAVARNPEAQRLLAHAGHARTLPIFARALEKALEAQAEGVSGASGDDGLATERGALIRWALGKLFGAIAEEIVTEALTPDCSGAKDTLACQDCCDAHWVGHYPSLKNCYLNCM